MDDRIFSTDRLRLSTTVEERPPKQQFESDRGRVLFSSPFRRMQSKAQVFSLESNASVRSRLTHSMEVAHIGRYICHELIKEANRHNDSDFVEQCSMIEPIVETACLLHDIGNPPFGHLGESAVQEWFKANASNLFLESTEIKIDKLNSYYKDFENFDGNPQGARIVLTLQGLPGKKGFNLTAAQIASIIKYPRFSSEEDKSEKYKKIAVFSSEKESIEEVWRLLDLNWGERHPLVFLMEAADDIAYCLSDIEDGIEKKIIREKDIIRYLRKTFRSLSDDLKNCIPAKDRSGSSDVVGGFLSFRTRMINTLVTHAAKYFYEHRNDISHLGINAIFKKGDQYSEALSIVRRYCSKYIYKSQAAEDIEIAGYNIVYGLLDKFSIFLSMDKEAFTKLVFEKKGTNLEMRMFSKLPPKFIEHYKKAVSKDDDNEWFLRFQLILDYVSGMTDDFALKLYRLLHGIEVSLV